LQYDPNGKLIIAYSYTDHELIEGEHLILQIGEKWISGFATQKTKGEWVLLSKKDNTEVPLKRLQQVKFQLSARDILIDELERELTGLAMHWRSFHRQGLFQEAKDTVEKYLIIFQKLWDLEWIGTNLPPDSELPDELMPQYFLEFWEKRGIH
jgi:hypothetical protein